jgi:hypothetical protein
MASRRREGSDEQEQEQDTQGGALERIESKLDFDIGQRIESKLDQILERVGKGTAAAGTRYRDMRAPRTAAPKFDLPVGLKPNEIINNPAVRQFPAEATETAAAEIQQQGETKRQHAETQ